MLTYRVSYWFRPAHVYTESLFLFSMHAHNEKAGDIPFPAWMNPTWHNCLIGCFRCQRICPENKDFLQWVEGREEFSEEETALLLKGVALDRLPPTTARKLKRLDLIEYFDRLPRNMGVFFSKSEHSRDKR